MTDAQNGDATTGNADNKVLPTTTDSRIPDETGRDENQRAVSQSLTAAAGALMTALLTAVAFLALNREPSTIVWLAMAVAMALFAASVYCGARGVANLWRPRAHRPVGWFNRQAIALLVGFLAFAVAFGLGLATRPSERSPQPDAQRDLAALEPRIAVAEAKLSEIAEIERRVAAAEKTLAELAVRTAPMERARSRLSVPRKSQ
jgi:hypothetical protein